MKKVSSLTFVSFKEVIKSVIIIHVLMMITIAASSSSSSSSAFPFLFVSSFQLHNKVQHYHNIQQHIQQRHHVVNFHHIKAQSRTNFLYQRGNTHRCFMQQDKNNDVDVDSTVNGTITMNDDSDDTTTLPNHDHNNNSNNSNNSNISSNSNSNDQHANTIINQKLHHNDINDDDNDDEDEDENNNITMTSNPTEEALDMPPFLTSLMTQIKEITQPQIPPLEEAKIDPQLTPKAFNFALLLLSFGFAFYSILNVDDGMTRGWSISEKAMRIPLDNWSSYESLLNTQPIFTKTMINVVIYLLGDWLSQTLFVQRNLLEFDAWKMMRNGLIGMCFGPLVHEYYEFSDYILPVEVGVNRFYKIFMDQTIYIFVKCNIYIIAVNMLAGQSREYSVREAKTKIGNIMFTAWRFWPLVHCVTYGAIPARHRILWVNCVDLFWNAILASLAGKENNNDDDDTNEQVDDIVVANNHNNITIDVTNTKNDDHDDDTNWFVNEVAAVTKASLSSSNNKIKE